MNLFVDLSSDAGEVLCDLLQKSYKYWQQYYRFQWKEVVIVLSETIDRREGLEDSGFQLYITEVYEKGMPIFSLFLSHFVSETLSLALSLRDSFWTEIWYCGIHTSVQIRCLWNGLSRDMKEVEFRRLSSFLLRQLWCVAAAENLHSTWFVKKERNRPTTAEINLYDHLQVNNYLFIHMLQRA